MCFFLHFPSEWPRFSENSFRMIVCRTSHIMVICMQAFTDVLMWHKSHGRLICLLVPLQIVVVLASDQLRKVLKAFPTFKWHLRNTICACVCGSYHMAHMFMEASSWAACSLGRLRLARMCAAGKVPLRREKGRVTRTPKVGASLNRVPHPCSLKTILFGLRPVILVAI